MAWETVRNIWKIKNRPAGVIFSVKVRLKSNFRVKKAESGLIVGLKSNFRVKTTGNDINLAKLVKTVIFFSAKSAGAVIFFSAHKSCFRAGVVLCTGSWYKKLCMDNFAVKFFSAHEITNGHVF